MLVWMAMAAMAADPAWLEGCTRSGEGASQQLSCQRGVVQATVSTGLSDPPSKYVEAYADGFKVGSQGTGTHEGTRDWSFDGAEHVRVDVYNDGATAIYVVHAGAKVGGDGRLVQCKLRAETDDDARTVCGDVVTYTLANGVPATLPLTEPAGAPLVELLGAAWKVGSDCKVRESADLLAADCDSGVLQIMRAPPGVDIMARAGDVLGPSMQPIGATPKGPPYTETCTAGGAEVTCARVDGTIDGGEMHGIMAPVAGGAAVALCLWAAPMPSACAAMFPNLDG